MIFRQINKSLKFHFFILPHHSSSLMGRTSGKAGDKEIYASLALITFYYVVPVRLLFLYIYSLLY